MMQDFTPVSKMDKIHYALDAIMVVLSVIIVVNNVQIAIVVTPVMIVMIVMIVIVAMLAMIVMVASRPKGGCVPQFVGHDGSAFRPRERQTVQTNQLIRTP